MIKRGGMEFNEVPPPYEGGVKGVVEYIVKLSNPLFHLPLHKGEKRKLIFIIPV